MVRSISACRRHIVNTKEGGIHPARGFSHVLDLAALKHRAG